MVSPSRKRVVDVELSAGVADLNDLDGYAGVLALIRLHRVPLGSLSLPIVNGCCPATTILRAVEDQLADPLLQHALADAMAQPHPLEFLAPERLGEAPHAPGPGTFPAISVAVCTRDRPDDLTWCLSSLDLLDYPGELDVLVIDNAPATDASERLVTQRFPRFRYVREPRPGLDWARNRAVLEARGDIVAFTDDDVVVDPFWVREVARPFTEDAEVMALTGLVVPFELETESQEFFERYYGGFGKGFQRRWHRVDVPAGERAGTRYAGAGALGTGANMAFRRDVFEHVGMFDPALDVGTCTNGGGDLDMFFRVLKAGFTLAYEPAAVVRHRHRSSLRALGAQVANNGTGLYAYFTRNFLAHRDERRPLVKLASWWLWRWYVRRYLISLLRPARLPRGFVAAELTGALRGPRRYLRARREARAIEKRFGALGQGAVVPGGAVGTGKTVRTTPRLAQDVCTVDLASAVPALDGLERFAGVRAYVTGRERALGLAEIPTRGSRTVSATQLRDTIAQSLGVELVRRQDERYRSLREDEITAAVLRAVTATSPSAPTRARLPDDQSASVVIATRDRPDDLRRCLRAVLAEPPRRPLEVIVVDNNPMSGFTAPVVREFPSVRLVEEARQGLAYARNRGITASTGSIVVCTDDDVTVPPGWLENLLAPFSQPDVMVVSGNTLPLELETDAQVLFEWYGGLGRGFKPLRIDGAWFEGAIRRTVPTWELGATANAAFRSAIFTHPDIGLMDEVLGPGTPTGVGEDTYLFYKVLKAGYTIVYEPTAFVWHRHRRDMAQLRKQLYDYSKGHIAYHLTTLFQDGDVRAVVRIGAQLPLWRVRQLARAVTGRSRYPASLSLLEAKGNAAGPWALVRSHLRVRRDGRSAPYPSSVPGDEEPPVWS